MELIALGFLIGLALGLTGAGGSIIAVPLLMYVLDLRPQDAMGISLGAVSAAAMVGVLLRRRRGHPPIWNAVLALAVTGMFAAPLGRWLSHQIDERVIVVLFSLLAVYLARKMWSAEPQQANTGGVNSHIELLELPSERVTFFGAGIGLGLLSGLFGVGGGFLIVPFLNLYARMNIEKAISTSLLVIALIGSSGYLYHVVTSPAHDNRALSVIGLGSIVGILLGTHLSAQLSGKGIQKLFSGFVVLMMSYVLFRTLA